MNDKPKIDTDHTMLLVMDYQPVIIKRMPNPDQLLARMANVIKVARAKSVKVGYIRVAFTDDDYENMPEYNERFKAIANEHGMHHGSPDTAVHGEIAPEPGDLVIRKIRVGAFSTTDLDKQLKENEINTLVLAGLSTSGVVLSTVREASDRDYRIYVLEDGSADGDQEVHDFLTKKIFPRQAKVISSSDFIDLLETE